MFQRFLLLLPIIVLGCNSQPPVLPEGIEDCEGSCIVLEHFDCPEKGENREECATKCRSIRSVGYVWTDDSSGPSCIIKAQTLSDVRACNVKCPK